MELTEVEFWNRYWANCSLPSRVDYSVSFERCLANSLKKILPRLSGNVFEVGCAPGKWLAFMAEEYGLAPNGIEYSEAGMKATVENFQKLGLNGGKIIAGDFFSTLPSERFDVVMSFGFIEHFDNVDEVVEKHLAWLRPGGKLILGVPNFRGIYSPIQKILDREILEKHNLGIMNLEFFHGLASTHDVTPLYVGYLGSFEPSLPISKRGFGNPLQAALKSMLRLGLVLRKFRVFDGINHPWISSYILAVYSKDAK